MKRHSKQFALPKREPKPWDSHPGFLIQMQLETRNYGWTAFDFDGVLAHFEEWTGPASLGAPIQPMLDLLKETISNSERVRIFTSRIWPVLNVSIDGAVESQEQNAMFLNNALVAVEAIRNWCVEQLGFPLAITCVKDPACVRIYDDIAIQVERNTGRLVLG